MIHGLLIDTDAKDEDIRILPDIPGLFPERKILLMTAGNKYTSSEAKERIIRKAGFTQEHILRDSDHPYARRNKFHGDKEQNNIRDCLQEGYRFLSENESTDILLTSGASNLAYLLHAFPEAAEYISRIVFAGGCYCFGDVTPNAERNAYYDPEGLQFLLHTGIPFYFVPLELSERTDISKTALGILTLIYPELFSFVRYKAETEIYADYTRGMTIIYRNGLDYYEILDDEYAGTTPHFVREEDKNAFYPEVTDAAEIIKVSRETFHA